MWENDTRRCFRVERALEIDAPVEIVFDRWNRYEELPYVMDGVRRTKRIGPENVLFDVEVAGRQVVFEARILESTPCKLVRWVSSWGVKNRGAVRFVGLPEHRTRVAVSIEFRPRGWLERLGAHLGLVGFQIDHDLACFRRSVEGPLRRGEGGRTPIAS